MAHPTEMDSPTIYPANLSLEDLEHQQVQLTPYRQSRHNFGASLYAELRSARLARQQPPRVVVGPKQEHEQSDTGPGGLLAQLRSKPAWPLAAPIPESDSYEDLSDKYSVFRSLDKVNVNVVDGEDQESAHEVKDPNHDRSTEEQEEKLNQYLSLLCLAATERCRILIFDQLSLICGPTSPSQVAVYEREIDNVREELCGMKLNMDDIDFILSQYLPALHTTRDDGESSRGRTSSTEASVEAILGRDEQKVLR